MRREISLLGETDRYIERERERMAEGKVHSRAEPMLPLPHLDVVDMDVVVVSSCIPIVGVDAFMGFLNFSLCPDFAGICFLLALAFFSGNIFSAKIFHIFCCCLRRFALLHSMLTLLCRVFMMHFPLHT